MGLHHSGYPARSGESGAMYQIVRRHQFSESTFLWDVYAPDVARAAQPGHFVMLRLREGESESP